MQPNLLQHSREIHHSARHSFRARWVCRHGAVNGITFVSAISPVENYSVAARAPRHTEELRHRTPGSGVTCTNRYSRHQFVYTLSTSQKLPRSATAAEHAGAHRATNMGFSRSFQIMGSATAATMI